MSNSHAAFPVDDRPSVAIPTALLDRLVAQAGSREDFRVVLLLASLSHQEKGPDLPVAEDAFASHPAVIEAGRNEGTSVVDDSWPWQYLDTTHARGFILRFVARNDSGSRNWLLLNTVRNATYISNLSQSVTDIDTRYWIAASPTQIAIERPTVFRLYEQNIGPLTPMIAQRLIKALEDYPAEWLESAFEEAVAYNRRNWRYIVRILENWAIDGPGGRTSPR